MHPDESSTELRLLSSTQSTPTKNSRWFGRRQQRPVPAQTARVGSPDDGANPLSKAYFQWVQHIITLGRKKTIELDDVWLVSTARESDTLSRHLKVNIENTPTLLKAISLTLRRDVVVGGVAQLLASIIGVLNPFILRFAIQAVEDDRSAYLLDRSVSKIGSGVGIIICIWVLQIIQGLCTNQSLYRGNLVGLQAKATIVPLVLEKSLYISGKKRLAPVKLSSPPPTDRTSATGLLSRLKEKVIKDKKAKKVDDVPKNDDEVLKLVMTDLNTLQSAAAQMHLAWTIPVAVIVGTAFLVANVREAALVGLAVFLTGPPLMSHMITKMKGQQAAKRIIGERIGLVREMLTLVRAIKLFAWQDYFIARFNKLRKDEVAAIQKGTIKRIAVFTVTITLPGVACMLTFVTCSLANIQFNAASVFSTLALFNGLRAPLATLPRLFSDVAEARTVIERVEAYLNIAVEDEAKKYVKEAVNVIELENAEFMWEKAAEDKSEKHGKPGKGGNKASSRPSSRMSNFSLPLGLETVYARFSNISLPSFRDSVHSRYSNFMHPTGANGPNEANSPYGRPSNTSFVGSIDTTYSHETFYQVPSFRRWGHSRQSSVGSTDDRDTTNRQPSGLWTPPPVPVVPQHFRQSSLQPPPLSKWPRHSPQSSIETANKRETTFSQLSNVSYIKENENENSRQSTFLAPPVIAAREAVRSPSPAFSMQSQESNDSMAKDTDAAYFTKSQHPPSAWKGTGHSPQTSVSNRKSRERRFSWESNGSGEDSDVGSSRKQSRKPSQQPDKQTERLKSIQQLEGKSAGPFRLTDIDFTCKADDFIGIVGGVGSGKSSLLAALAGEMKLSGGEFRVRGTLAYCSQTAWIQNATVRQNILFGAPFDQGWYNQVVSACALQQDFDAMPNGDETELGEKGTNISGGQRQRISLARATYRRAEVILLDDPISALDNAVAKVVLQDGICGLLRDKCRFLATHHLWALEKCTQIWYLENGGMTKYNSVQSLSQTQPEFVRQSESQKTTAGVQTKPKSPAKEGAAAGKKPPGPNKNLQFLMAKEDIATKVTWKTITRFANNSRHAMVIWPLMVLLWILAQASTIAPNIWLSEWLQHRLPWSTSAYVGLYIGLVALQIVLAMCFGVLLAVGVARASEVTLKNAVTRIFQAPVTFFDINPQGRIMARLIKDSTVTDWTLAVTVRVFLTTFGGLIAACVIIIAYEYFLVAAFVPLLAIMAFIFYYQQKSAPSILGLEANLGNTLTARFTEALAGAPTIKSYGVERIFLGTVHATIDDLDSVSIIKFACQRWVNVRVDTLSSLLTLVVGLVSTLSYKTIPAATAGLCLAMSLTAYQTITFTIRQYTDVLTALGAVTRLDQYCHGAIETSERKSAPLLQPQTGSEIKFVDLSMQYRPGLPRVLRDINIHIPAGYHVGIVGRTGAGKSSIISALARLNKYDGKIIVDGEDIADFSLDEWRRQLTVIPQQAVLFKGTVRSNLDPEGRMDDADLWFALRQAGLIEDNHNFGNGYHGGNAYDDHGYTSEESTASAKPNRPATDTAPQVTLDTELQTDGLPLSQGKRQLLALARAILHSGSIVICDEATSGLDTLTDRKVQETVKRVFSNKTLLYIAHRLKSVLGYDLICVMDGGKVVEYGPPLLLWEKGGSFHDMCVAAGIGRKEIG